MTTTCTYPACTSAEAQAYTRDGATVMLCAKHAVEGGFCLWCRKASLYKGYHPECLTILETVDEELEGEVK